MSWQGVALGISASIAVLLAALGYEIWNADDFGSPVFVEELDEQALASVKQIEFSFDASEHAKSYREEQMPWLLPVEFNTAYLDSNFMPVMRVDSTDYRNPVYMSNAAFYFYQLYQQTNEEHVRDRFLRNADWLKTNQNNGYYHYPFAWRHYGETETGGLSIVEFEPGWVSGMAQGQALAVLSLAYEMTRDSSYLKAASDVFETFRRNAGSNWIFALDDDGYYWLEQYPSADFCHVLNGSLFGLWGVWNYYVITGDNRALAIFKAGTRSVVDHIRSWNIKGENNSLYCRHRAPGKVYHGIAIGQLEAYAAFLDLPVLARAAESFRR